MEGYEHATMCVGYAKDLDKELGVQSKMSFAYINDKRVMVYCHPEDFDKKYVKDFEYPHREL
jgi:hypothetical protein